MNETENQQAERDFIRRQRIALGLGAALTAFMIFFSVKFFDLAGEANLLRMPTPVFVLFGLAVSLYLFAAGTLFHRKWKTGRFLMTRAESLAKQEEVWGKLGAGKPLWPQRWYLFFAALFLTLPAFLTIQAIFLLRNFPIQLSPQFFVLPLVLIAIALALPGWFIYKAIRRKLKTGNFLPSQEEISKLRAKSQKPQPLGTRIFTANAMAFCAGLFAFTSIRDHIRHSSAFGFPWVFTPFWTFMAAIFIWQVFRPIKPLTATSDALEEPQENPMNRGKLIALGLILPLILAFVPPVFALLTVHPIPAIYPAPAQAKVDLAAALQSAAQSHKRILLDFGESWCGDCQALDRYFHDAPNRVLVDSSYIHVLVNTENPNPKDYSNANQDLADRYSIPLDKGIPALAVLNEKGDLIFSQRSGEFEEMRHLKSSDLTAFLLRWKPQELR